MNIVPEQLEQEKQYLKKTLEIIKSLIAEDDESIQSKINAINEMKRYIWENNTVLDDAEIAIGMYNVNTDVSYTNESIKKLQKLKRSLINPYFGRVDFELTGTPLDSNYKFDDLSLSCSVSRMKAGPEITDTIELTPGKTYRECFTFMLSEEFGTYEINQYTNITSLDEKVPESLPLSQVSLDFTSNSCLYYSGIIRFNVKIVKNDLIDDSGNYDEVYPESDGALE